MNIKELAGCLLSCIVLGIVFISLYVGGCIMRPVNEAVNVANEFILGETTVKKKSQLL